MKTDHRWLIILHHITSIYAEKQGTIIVFHWHPTAVNSGKYGQQKWDFDQWWHGSNTHLVEDTSLLTCNRNVPSGKEATMDFNLWQEEHNLELKNSNVSNTQSGFYMYNIQFCRNNYSLFLRSHVYVTV